MQQAVEARNRRSEEQLGVRIGVSLGEATVQDGDYFGEPVVEAARLCAHAAGGQIVVNALVRQLGGSRDGHQLPVARRPRAEGHLRAGAGVRAAVGAGLSGAIALPERLRELPATAYVGRVAERERLDRAVGAGA